MSSTFQSIVDIDATPDEASSLADGMVAWFLEIGLIHPSLPVYRNETTLDGLQVITTRTVFYSLDGEPAVACRHCGWRFEGIWDDLTDRIGEWHNGGPGRCACPVCGRDAGLNDWHWSPPWAFGHLGFTFWNCMGWLEPNVLAAVANRLGHRIINPHGKL